MRRSGILLPLFSLPSPYGIGTMGKTAFQFIDFLSECEQYYWQILPTGPTTYSNSPYQSTSAFAGNPYFIDLDELVDMGLISKKDTEQFASLQGDTIDYAYLYRNRIPLIKKAAKELFESADDYELFKSENSYWLEDYCFYMVIKEKNNMRPLAKPIKEYLDVKDNLISETEIQAKIQYLFFQQWKKLKQYANSKNVHIIGDIPIYVSHDSSDFFAHRELFYCSEKGELLRKAGCPPDPFSPNGQLWGNPLYNWNDKKDECFSWWKERFHQASQLFDCVRIDHFRGIYEYYSIPANAENAKKGEWVKGPGMEFVSMLRESFPNLEIIAEDLGFLTDDTRAFFKESGYRGMKILQFAFNDKNSEYLPHNHTPNSVCYTGTHDNPTALSWLCSASREEINFALDYFGVCRISQLTHCLIMGALSSVCNTAIIPLQDYMDVGCKGRINTPGTEIGNWEYRLPEDYCTPRLKNRILHYTKTYSRSNREETQ